MLEIKTFIGNNQYSGLSEEDRFWQKVNKQSDDECWNWTASTNKKGYGQFVNKTKKFIFAHRKSWEINFGEIPTGYLVLHTCDNPRCVNPKHLFLGTNDDNMKDMSEKHRSTWGYKSTKAKLSIDDVITIRNTPKYFGVINQLAEKFNVSRSTIYTIRNFKTWKYLN